MFVEIDDFHLETLGHRVLNYIRAAAGYCNEYLIYHGFPPMLRRRIACETRNEHRRAKGSAGEHPNTCSGGPKSTIYAIARANISAGQHVQQAEVIQVAVIKFRLVVPFHLDAYAVLEVVYLVCRNRNIMAVNRDFNVEGLRTPARFAEKAVNRNRDRRAAASRRQNIFSLECESFQCSKYVGELVGKIARQNRGRMAAFLKAIARPNIFRD